MMSELSFKNVLTLLNLALELLNVAHHSTSFL